MLVAAILLIVTGRSGERPKPVFTVAGLGVVSVYIVIWMIHGKRSPPLFGVLATLCAYYASRGKRPSKPVLAATAVAGGDGRLAGDRLPRQHELRAQPLGLPRSTSPSSTSAPTLVNLNVKSQHDDEIDLNPEKESHETEEYGGFLLMMDTVPAKSDYDYGASYHPPRLDVHPAHHLADKPIFGREQWVNAWIAGSEFKRDSDFTGPAIGILGATQLNGGAWGTLIVLGILALLLRTGYEYFRRYAVGPVGPGVVVLDVLQRVADDGQRRPVRLVLLHLRPHHGAAAGLPLDLPEVRVARVDPSVPAPHDSGAGRSQVTGASTLRP